MGLMICIDDAVNVLRYEGAIENNDEAEWVRNMLEQKCYLIMRRKSQSWIDVITRELNEEITPEEVAKHIVSGDLKEWLNDCKNVFMAQFELIAKEQEQDKATIEILTKDINYHNCNTCINVCKMKPRPGEVTRVNCFHWQGSSAEQRN